MKTIIAALLLIPTLAFAGEPLCGNGHEKRIVKGVDPTATVLYKKLKNIELGSWESGFWEETFTYIGDAHTKSGKLYRIGFLTTVWEAACRTTNRLFIFNSNNVCLGQYGDISEPPIKIVGPVLYFPFDGQDGSTLDLESGPPATAWLDGENPEWMPAKSSNKSLMRGGHKTPAP
jgi:hypothetical protein